MKLVIVFSCLSYAAEWNYLDQSVWPGACSTGLGQSPIDIVGPYKEMTPKSDPIRAGEIYPAGKKFLGHENDLINANAHALRGTAGKK